MSGDGEARVDLDDGLDGLYLFPPELFIAGRESLVKALRRAKRREEAARVHTLVRPSIAVWAANRVSRQAGEMVNDLVAAGTPLIDAQRAAFENGDASGLRPAQAKRREAVRLAVSAAVTFLAEQGRCAAAPVEELTAIFEAASVDTTTAAHLRQALLPRTPSAVDALEILKGFALSHTIAPREPRSAYRPDSPVIPLAAPAHDAPEVERQTRERAVAQALEAVGEHETRYQLLRDAHFEAVRAEREAQRSLDACSLELSAAKRWLSGLS